MPSLLDEIDDTPRIEIERVAAWGPMTWAGRIRYGLCERGNWYAWTERGIERKMRRLLARETRDTERRRKTRRTIEAL